MKNNNNSKNNFCGKLILGLGCMFSGKTSWLISRYNRHAIANRSCIMIKYKHDIRYDKEKIVTHDGIKVNAVICERLEEFDDMAKSYQVICIDEIQFYKDAPQYCDKWANEGVIVEACGLNGSFDRKPFPMISNLLPLAEEIIFLKAVCRETGDDAVFTQRLTNETEQEIIGGTEMYTAVDRLTYFKSKTV